jgi:PncC family amidohydrolase
MINGLKNKNNSDIIISTTGIAGPEGGSKKKPVGTVFHSFYIKKKATLTIKNFYEGSRYSIRLKASMFSISETFKKLNSII